MDDLFEEIKNNIDLQPEVPLPSTAWDNFSHYRNERDKSNGIRKSFWLPLFLCGIIGLFLWSNLYWMNKFQNIQTTSQIIRDTIYITQLSTIPLTNEKKDNTPDSNLIKQNQGLRSSEVQLAYALQEIKTLKNQFALLYKQGLDFKDSFSKVPSTTFPQLTYSNLKNNTKNTLETSKKVDRTIATLHNLYSTDASGYLTTLELKHLLPLESKKEKRNFTITKPILKQKKRTFLEAIQPKSLSINLDGGYLFGLNNKYGTSNGYAVGLKIATHFSDKIRGKLGILGSISNTDINDPANAPDLPIVVPPENGILGGVYAQNKRMVISAGMEHVLFPIKKWKPFYGLGYAFEFESNYSFEFEFYTPIGESYVRTEAIKEKTTRYFIYLTSGFEYDFNTSFSIGFTGSYFRSMKGGSGDYFYFSPGLYYHF